VRARAQTLISMCPRGQRPTPPSPHGHPWTMAEPPLPPKSVHVEYGRPLIALLVKEVQQKKLVL